MTTAKETEGFDSVEACLADIRAGKFVVIVDDEGREIRELPLYAAFCLGEGCRKAPL